MANHSNNIKLLNILNEMLSEVGDLQNIKPYDFGYKPIVTSFPIENGDLVSMRLEDETDTLRSVLDISKVFEKDSNKIFNLSFDVNGKTTQAKKTSLTELIRILKTVSIFAVKELERINTGLSKNNKPIVVIGSQSKTTKALASDPQKYQLYSNIISQNIPSNYRIDDAKVLNIPVIVIQRIK